MVGMLIMVGVITLRGLPREFVRCLDELRTVPNPFEQSIDKTDQVTHR